MKRSVTIKDVAQIAGVAHTTVSRVINKDSRITQATCDRVRRAMKKLDYQPNLIARGLVRNRTQVIALIGPEVANFFLPIIRSVAESSASRDYAMMLFSTNTWIKEAMSFEWVAQNWLVDGMLVYNLIHHPEVPPEIIKLKSRISPFVFINKFLREPEMNAVGVDNYHAVNLAVEHLVALDHRRIGIFYGDVTSVDGFERKDAFEKALRKAGVPVDPSLEFCGMWRDEDAFKETLRMLEGDARPTAIFCANDIMAIGAMRAIREKGLSVPRDISLVGFDDLETSRYIDVPLTTIRPPLADVGTRSVELLMDVLKDPTRPPQQIALHAELIVRASTAKPAG